MPKSPTVLDFALRYARAGYPVVAVYPIVRGRCGCGHSDCDSPGKHPIGGPLRAATRLPSVRALFRRYPKAGVGIQPPPGCVIVDVDPRDDGDVTLAMLQGAHAMPRTPKQRTGGGGLHLVFRGDIDAGTLGPGIQIKRAGKGFVVAAPSPHVSGRRYRWEVAPWECEPAPLPHWLRPPDPPPLPPRRPARAFDALHSRFDARALARELLRYIDPSDHDTWLRVGMALRWEYGDRAWPLFDAWSKRTTRGNYDEVKNWKRWRSFAAGDDGDRGEACA